LDLEQLELPFADTRPPDSHAPSVDDAARADVR
jgi:hypothetical protein